MKSGLLVTIAVATAALAASGELDLRDDERVGAALDCLAAGVEEWKIDLETGNITFVTAGGEKHTTDGTKAEKCLNRRRAVKLAIQAGVPCVLLAVAAAAVVMCFLAVR